MDYIKSFKNENKENILPSLEYIPPVIFISETPLEESPGNKKVSKFKATPKWHHYCWDIIK